MEACHLISGAFYFLHKISAKSFKQRSGPPFCTCCWLIFVQSCFQGYLFARRLKKYFFHTPKRLSLPLRGSLWVLWFLVRPRLGIQPPHNIAIIHCWHVYGQCFTNCHQVGTGLNRLNIKLTPGQCSPVPLMGTPVFTVIYQPETKSKKMCRECKTL